MAVAGGAKPSIGYQIIANELIVVDNQAMRQGVVSDIDIAVQRLSCGEKVYVSTYTPVHQGVLRTVQMMLGGG
jgi:hypothetical protein